MKVKEALENLTYGANYQLVGAKTGKTLLRSWISKKNERFNERDVASIEATVRIRKDSIFNLPEQIQPVVVIMISGL
jgi:hypothetical protein